MGPGGLRGALRGARGDGLSKVTTACSNTRVVIQKKHMGMSTMSQQLMELADLDNVLIDNGQHCLFKHDGLIIEPDDGGIAVFDAKTFAAQQSISPSRQLVVAAVLIFATKEAALDWRRWEKCNQKAEQQARQQQARRKKPAAKRSLVL